MKNTIKLTSAFFVALLMSVAGYSQAVLNGSVDFSVSVPEAFDIRSNGNAVIGAAGGIVPSGSQTANDPLAVLLTVADASPNANNSILTAGVPIRLRSNRSYQLTAVRQTPDAASSADFDSSDIGMSLVFGTRAGARVNTGGSDLASNGFGAAGKTVADLSAAPLQIATGDRISNQGDNLSTDNFQTASLDFSIKRQYYTPTATPFTQQITVGISAAP